MNLNKLLIEAVQLGILPIVRQLVEVGCITREDYDWALKLAAQLGHLEIVTYLISNELDARDLGLDRILERAVNGNNLETVKYLVSVGANVRFENDWVLRWASYKGYDEVANFLHQEIAKLENKAKVL